MYNTHSFKLQALKSYGCSVIGWYLVRTISEYPGQSLRRRPGQMLSNNDFLLMLRRRSRCTPPPPHPLSECRHLQRNSFLLLVAIGEGVTVDSKSLAQFCRPHSELQTRVSPGTGSTYTPLHPGWCLCHFLAWVLEILSLVPATSLKLPFNINNYS